MWAPRGHTKHLHDAVDAYLIDLSREIHFFRCCKLKLIIGQNTALASYHGSFEARDGTSVVVEDMYPKAVWLPQRTTTVLPLISVSHNGILDTQKLVGVPLTRRKVHRLIRTLVDMTTHSLT
jgi:hypothetical protein